MTQRNHLTPSVLVVDDDAELAKSLQHYLSRTGCTVECCYTGEQALAKVVTKSFDVIVSDLRMPGMSGIELLSELQSQNRTPPLILITAHGEVPLAVDAMRGGAFDFVEKPFEPDHLLERIQRAATMQYLREENSQLKHRLSELTGLEKMLIGNSSIIRQLREEVSDIAAIDASVLIYGETGTGKEIVARSLHTLSHRASGSFVALNCAAIPEQLFESMLFGHTAGAFTGATKASPGQFVSADGGSLFLDEISSLPINLQPKLLRALQEHEVLPVGGTQAVKFDARIISALNESPDKLIADNAFREDLFFRLNTLTIEIPPLRNRLEDVLMIFTARIEQYAARYSIEPPALTEEDINALVTHRWPGNVRELESVAERAVLASRRGTVRVKDVIGGASELPNLGASLRERVENYETLLIGQALLENNGDVGQCAKQLSLARRTLDEKITRYGIDRDQYRNRTIK